MNTAKKGFLIVRNENVANNGIIQQLKNEGHGGNMPTRIVIGQPEIFLKADGLANFLVKHNKVKQDGLVYVKEIEVSKTAIGLAAKTGIPFGILRGAKMTLKYVNCKVNRTVKKISTDKFTLTR